MLLLRLRCGLRLGLGDVPWEEAPKGDVLDHHAFSEDFRLDRTVNLLPTQRMTRARTYLVHLEQP